MEGLIMATKIRKRGCSSSSSPSSRVCSYRLNKRAILVGKNRVGLGRSRSNTPAPTWRTTPLRSGIDSPKYCQSGKSTRPVSARRLAATLWQMNEMPSPKMSESNSEAMKQRQQKKNGSRLGFKGENLRVRAGLGLHSGSGPLPPQLLDPPHSPAVSEKIDRSGTGSHRRRAPSISQRLLSADQNAVLDSISNASFMEIETRSRPQTSSGSVVGCKNRLKDVSSALTTSKELLKIINRIWAHADQRSSSMSLISALHTELERARLQVNHLIQEQRSEKNEINYLMKCLAKEKALWKSQEQQAVEGAIGSIAGELEVERKLRRRLESLNAKLGKEVAEIKLSFMKAVKELESEKRAREITERICEELAHSIDEDRAEVEKLKRESVKVHEEVEKEREMLELADKLREERVHMKLSEAKHQFEEKNSTITKLRKQLEGFLSPFSSKPNIGPHHNEERVVDELVDDGNDSKEDHSGESDLHLIELDFKARNPISGQVSRRSLSLQKSVSDGVLGEEGIHEIEKEAPRSGCLDETVRLKSVKGVKNQLLPSSRLGLARQNHTTSQKKEQSRPSKDPCGKVPERSSLSKSRTTDLNRKSKW